MDESITSCYRDAQPQAAPIDILHPRTPTAESERLLAVRFWRSKTDTTGTGEELLPWTDLARWLTAHGERRQKDGKAFSPTLYRRDSEDTPLPREAAHVAHVSCLVLDFDKGAPPEALEADWRALGLAYALHSTHSHTAELVKWRVCFPLTCDVAAADWRGVYTRLAAALGCGNTDKSTKDPSRLFYLPSCEPGAPRFKRIQPGRFLDPEEFGSGSPAPTPLVAAPARFTSSRRGKRSPEALKAELLCRALDQAPDGRNPAWFWLAGQLRDNGYSEGEARALLPEFLGSCPEGDHPFTEAEAHATLRSAYSQAPREPWSERQTVTRLPRAPGADQADPPEAGQLAAAAAEQENDIGNGRRFAWFHGDDVRHTPEMGWLAWDGRRWRPDEVAVAALAKATATRIFYEVPHVAESGGNDAAIRRGKWAKTSGTGPRLREMLWCASSEAKIAARREAFDTGPWLLNCANGTVDLRTGTLRPHRREDLLTRICPVEYDREARSEQWERFLTSATEGNRDLAEFLARAVGYTLSGSTREEVLFFVHGPTGAGKSTFVEAIKATLGEYATTANFDTFLQRRSEGGPRGDIARLAGSRFVVSIEVDEGKRLAEGLVKTFTGGDTITAAFKFKDDFEFRPEAKLWLVANHAPRVRDDDSAIWRRILRLPFEHALPTGERDPRVKELLTNPALAGPAILAWAVRGCMDWQTNGLRVPEVVTRATDAYRESQDLVARFLADCCELHPTGWTASGALKTAFDAWARGNREKTLSAKEFATRLQSHGLETSRAGNARTRGFQGVELVETGELALFTAPPLRTDADGCTADSGKFLREFSHEEDFPDSGSDPSASVRTAAAALVSELW